MQTRTPATIVRSRCHFHPLKLVQKRPAQKANQSSMSRGLFSLSFVAALFVIAGVPSLQAQTASGWDKRGANAEVRQDYDAAYEAYKHAHQKKPKDLRITAHFDRMRFLAAVQHIDRGRLLRENGDFTGALQQFLRAKEIDPSNQAAQQEIIITQRNEPKPAPTGPGADAAKQETTQSRHVQSEIESMAPPVELKPVSNDPITYHAVEDVKNIYTSIGKLAGLNVIFDPDYVSKRIPVDLTNVTLSEALRIVGTIAGTFYKPITQNTIFVAQNTRSKRTDLDELAVQTFYLANATQANDGNEILTGLRLLLDTSVKLYFVPSQNAIVMRATTDQLMLAQKLIADFDRARPEVVVDVAVLEVNRDKLRNLGVTLPTSIGLTPSVTSTSTTSSSSTTTSSSSSSSSLSLSNLVHLNSNDFAVSLTGGTLNALLSDADTRVLQNPRIRATDGQKASLKIGQRIPIATGSYNAGVSTGVASIGVQTQFTYLDVGVNIEITPTVHYDREISLKAAVEVSQQNGSVTISNVTEPIIAQRKLDQTIQLKEGEPSLLAGIVTKQDLKNVSGTPFLGEIPFFKFFFSSQSKEVQTDEIVFLLIPHIVRESVLTRANLAAIDTGTSNSYELRRDDDPIRAAAASQPLMNPAPTVSAPSNAADAATAAIQQMNAPTTPNPVSPVAPPATMAITLPPPDQTGTGFAAPIALSLTPTSSIQGVGSTFQVAVELKNGKDIFSVPMQLQFNPAVLQLVNVDSGTFLSMDGKMATVVHRDDGNGTVTIGASRPPQSTGVTGNGSVAILTFKATAAGDSTISFLKAGAKNSNQLALPAAGTAAQVHVK
jgi:general secretion pathway protein D